MYNNGVFMTICQCPMVVSIDKIKIETKKKKKGKIDCNLLNLS